MSVTVGRFEQEMRSRLAAALSKSPELDRRELKVYLAAYGLRKIKSDGDWRTSSIRKVVNELLPESGDIKIEMIRMSNTDSHVANRALQAARIMKPSGAMEIHIDEVGELKAMRQMAIRSNRAIGCERLLACLKSVAGQEAVRRIIAL